MPLKKSIYTAAVLLAIAGASSAKADVHCSEGRTVLGECVNPLLAQIMRRGAIIFAQPKISTTAPLNLPSEDSFYPAAHDHHEERAFFGATQRPGRPAP